MVKRWVILFLIVLLPVSAEAGLPLLTDDAETQGAGKYQIEAGGEYDRDRETVDGIFSKETDHSISTTLTYGVAGPVDVFIASSYIRTVVQADGAGTTEARGISDTAAGLMWRFYTHEGLSLAVKPAVNVPTGDDEKGLGSGKFGYSTTFIVSKEIEPWEFHLNLGYARNNNTLGERVDVWQASLAMLYEVAKDFKLCADTGIETNRDAKSEIEPAYLLAGIVYEVKDNFELSLGLKTGLNKPETDWAVLPGATYRF